MTNGQPLKIAIASGKGGTGKTFVSTNLFYALTKRGLRATLVDCDAEAPNVLEFLKAGKSWEEEVVHQVPVIDAEKCVFCGKCHEYCEYKAIFYLPNMQVIKVMEELCHGCGACSYACGFGAIVEKPVSLGKVSGYQLNGGSALIESRTTVGVMSPVPLIKAAIGKIELDADIALFDSPPGTSCPFIQTAARADFIVLVTEPTPFGLSDLRQSVETLRQIDKPCGVIVNKAGLGNRDVYKYLEEENIPLLLEIPFSREIATAYTSGQLAAEAFPSLDDQFFQVFSTIKMNYGNSHHQR